MEIKLKELLIENFKGIKRFKIAFSDKTQISTLFAGCYLIRTVLDGRSLMSVRWIVLDIELTISKSW